ncbi:16S rRNA (adenine(1518)-N(6)/adenine(1519)-N(6))-dimethyltransferase [Candidatus Parcubacteria bacterium]|nr:MAG: 16S rRNA (adenine(1518)-N(6)/adenine(1519)-N(6))-dimethyltransferase [Candidatus Parcubacteria bacterium]
MNRPKKSLGQNFLKSSAIAREIVEAGEVGPDDIVLEVGPGRGILTEELLKKAQKVIAVEKDEELAEYLAVKFENNPKLQIVKGDVLRFNPSSYKLQVTGYKIIANIPYYITSRFLRTFLEDQPEGSQPSLMVLMVQKEVAERIVGQMKPGVKQNFSRFTLPRSAVGPPATQDSSLALRAGSDKNKESLLSISVKAYGRPEIIKRVPASFFSPPPKVDSAILKISGISKEFFEDIGEKSFFATLKKGFAQKRKMLINNLEMKPEDFATCGIPPKSRAEDLSLENWKCLTSKFSTGNPIWTS